MTVIACSGHCATLRNSGSEAQHGELRRAIVAHMRSVPFLVSGTGPDGNRNYLVTYDHGYHSVDDYLARSDMAKNGIRGEDFEMCVLAHMLDAPIYSYQADTNCWLCCFHHVIDRKCQCAFVVYFLEKEPFQVVTAEGEGLYFKRLSRYVAIMYCLFNFNSPFLFT